MPRPEAVTKSKSSSPDRIAESPFADWTRLTHPLPSGCPIPLDVIKAYAELRDPFDVRAISGGLLNQTFHVRTGSAEFVLQRVSPVFAPEIHDNIDAVTRHLRARDFPAPTLVRTTQGAHSIACGEAGRWRMMPHLGGICFESLSSSAQAYSAGQLVGRFHAALADFEAPMAPMGMPFHDIEHFVSQMESAFETHAKHPLAAELESMRAQLHEARAELGDPPDVPRRVIHGDLKIGNLIFQGENPPQRDRAHAIIDFDTLMEGPLWMELGDAWRSWCNRDTSEMMNGDSGQETNEFDLAIFEASLDGFFAGFGTSLAEGEIESLVKAPERLALELCVRFVTDALEERYFDWNSTQYPTRGAHNGERARRQWRFLRSARDTRTARSALVFRASHSADRRPRVGGE